jgi:hypothetical protein|tara:strand:- start:68 stop:541 length:474 start_codon:yes stop_codon:yes gene_type:complete
MNSGEIGFILFIVLFIGFGILKEIRSGELGEFLSFMKMMKTSQNDIFDEEGKSLRAQIDGKEVTLHIRTMMDFWKQTESIRESAKIYLEETGKMGRNLDLRFTSSQGDDWLEIRYFAGEEILRTEKINLDKEGPFKASSFVEEVFKETTPEGEEWWN